MKNEALRHAGQVLTQKRDSYLIKEVLSGNTASYAKLVAPYKKRIQALGTGFFHNESDVEDFVQEVLIKAFTSLQSFRGESLFSTWLLRIAYTTALNQKNRRHEYSSIADEEFIVSADGTPEEENMRRLTAEAVREAVKELPERYSECLDMYFFHDLTYDQISEVTELPVNTIKSHIFRAKKILRTKLKDFSN